VAGPSALRSMTLALGPITIIAATVAMIAPRVTIAMSVAATGTTAAAATATTAATGTIARTAATVRALPPAGTMRIVARPGLRRPEGRLMIEGLQGTRTGTTKDAAAEATTKRTASMIGRLGMGMTGRPGTETLDGPVEVEKKILGCGRRIRYWPKTGIVSWIGVLPLVVDHAKLLLSLFCSEIGVVCMPTRVLHLVGPSKHREDRRGSGTQWITANSQEDLFNNP